MKDLFYKTLFIEEHPQNVLFWSDTHFGHSSEHWPVPLWKMRGFSSIQHHDQELVNRWNAKATNDSLFFHLGDFIFGNSASERLISILREVSFKRLFVMPGNHFSGWKQLFEDQQDNVLNLTENKQVVFIPNYLEVSIKSEIKLVLSHYPLASFNKQNRGAIHCHGHCHGKLYESEIGKKLYTNNIIDVGIEKCEYPITAAELINYNYHG